MIISLDGNTYLGKTSVIDEWKAIFSECTVCAEYDTNLDELKGKTHLQKQQYYFELEAKRLEHIKKGRLIFLDRSCLSILAHSYAVSLMQNKNLLIETIELLKCQKEKKLIVCPQAGIFFIQPEEAKVYEDIDQKGGEEILYNTKYRKYIDLFYKRIVGLLRKEDLDNIYVCSKENRDCMIQWVREHCNRENNNDKTEFFDVLLFAVEQICEEMGINDDK